MIADAKISKFKYSNVDGDVGITRPDDIIGVLFVICCACCGHCCAARVIPLITTRRINTFTLHKLGSIIKNLSGISRTLEVPHNFLGY